LTASLDILATHITNQYDDGVSQAGARRNRFWGLEHVRFAGTVQDHGSGFSCDQDARGRVPWLVRQDDSGISPAFCDPSHELGVAWMAGADQYFFLAAATQLRKCVQRLSDEELPEPPNERMTLLLRNFTEHWEAPTGRSAVELRTTIPGAVPGRLTYTKHDIEIEGVSVCGIVDWSMNVERVLRANALRTGELLPDLREAGGAHASQ
jgi:hypothetical protein